MIEVAVLHVEKTGITSGIAKYLNSPTNMKLVESCPVALPIVIMQISAK